MGRIDLIRWGAIGAMFGGAVGILAGGVLSTPAFSGANPSWYQQNPVWYLVEFVGKAALLVGLAGLFLYLRRSPRFGWLGTAGFCVLAVITAYEVVLTLVALASAPAAEAADGFLGPIKELVKVLGILLFGIAVLRAGTLPRAGAWAMILAVLVVVASIGSFIVGPAAFADWSFPVAAVLFGLAFVLLGRGLWSHRDRPAGQARPARVR